MARMGPMSVLIERIRNEPVLVYTVIGAGLVLLTEFGINVTDSQQAAIIGFVVALMALVARSKVTPTTKA